MPAVAVAAALAVLSPSPLAGGLRLQRSHCWLEAGGCVKASSARFLLRRRRPSSGRRRWSLLVQARANDSEILLLAEGLDKSHDGEVFQFKDLNLTVSRGAKVGVVGANGGGKSTLLKVLAGKDSADSGSLQRRRGLLLAYLAQEPDLDGDKTVLESVLSYVSSSGEDSPLAAAVARYELAVSRVASASSDDDSSDLQAEMQAAMAQMDALGGAWELGAEAKKVLEQLGLGQSSSASSGRQEALYQREVRSLSGGQRKRAALAGTLLMRPELLLLDEPTNHLDIAAIEWLEKLLQDPELTLVLVTHDRFFLDRICNEIVEINDGAAYRHAGNYSKFLANKAEREAAAAAEVAAAKNMLRKEAEWMRRQPKARSTKSRARVDRFYRLTSRVEAGKKDAAEGIRLDTGTTRLGNKALALRNAYVKLGHANHDDGNGVASSSNSNSPVILDGFSYTFEPGERIGIVGRNGVGKSTLLDVLAGSRPLDSGEREAGETLKIGYFRQDALIIPDDVRVIDFVRQAGGETIELGGRGVGGFQGAIAEKVVVTAESFLSRFGFSRKKQFDWAAKLSGGERRRLALALVLMQRPNFLMLDEPTNDLDLPTIEVLEAYLKDYEGCLVVVSHDRAFMNNIAPRLFVLEGNGEVYVFEGNYEDYQEYKVEKEREDAAAAKAAAAKAAAKEARRPAMPEAASSSLGAASNGVSDNQQARRLSYSEKREFEKLEGQIALLGDKKASLEAELGTMGADADYAALMEISANLAKLEDEIDMKTERWLELAELAGA
eukprot:jgi/Chlat1/3139/Chrsp21S03372